MLNKYLLVTKMLINDLIYFEIELHKKHAIYVTRFSKYS